MGYSPWGCKAEIITNRILVKSEYITAKETEAQRLKPNKLLECLKPNKLWECLFKCKKIICTTMSFNSCSISFNVLY